MPQQLSFKGLKQPICNPAIARIAMDVPFKQRKQLLKDWADYVTARLQAGHTACVATFAQQYDYPYTS